MSLKSYKAWNDIVDDVFTDAGPLNHVRATSRGEVRLPKDPLRVVPEGEVDEGVHAGVLRIDTNGFSEIKFRKGSSINDVT